MGIDNDNDANNGDVNVGVEVEVEEEASDDDQLQISATKQIQTPLDKEIENEKKIYEQKLQSLRQNLNEQLTRFEQTERLRMEDKLKQIQKAYADLKAKYENETSRANKTQSVAIGTQTFECGSDSQADLIKRLKAENAELRQRVDSDRRQFRLEREQWLSEKQRYLQIQNLSSVSSSNWTASNANSSNNSKRNSMNILSDTSMGSTEHLQKQGIVPPKFNNTGIVKLCGPAYQNQKAAPQMKPSPPQPKQQHFI